VEPLTGVLVLSVAAAVIGAIVFGGSSLIYFVDKNRVLPPKPTAQSEAEERLERLRQRELDRAA
jgi:NhaP-type Na+/H+ or K+/H+ antiporter